MSKKQEETSKTEGTLDAFNLLMKGVLQPNVTDPKVVEPEPIEPEPIEPIVEVSKTSDAVITDEPIVDEEDIIEIEESEVSPYLAMAEFLSDKGIVDLDKEKFEDSEQGLETLIQNSIEKGIEEYRSGKSDEAKAFLEYLDNGGDPRRYIEFQSQPDYEAIEVTGDDRAQKEILKDYLRIQDYTDTEIEETLQDYEDSGILEKQAIRAKAKLVVYQGQAKQDMIERQKDIAKQQEVQHQNSLKELNTTIQTVENIAGFSLDKSARTKLYDHITKPVDRKTGKTQLMINFEKDPAIQLKMAYLDMIGWDLSKLEKKVESKVASKIKSSLNNYSDSKTKLRGNTGLETKTDVEEFVAFNKVFGKATK